MIIAIYLSNERDIEPLYIDVENWKPINGELHLVRSDGGREVFPARQWTRVREVNEPEQGPMVRDRHNPGDPPNRPPLRRKSDINDLTLVTADVVERNRAASVEFAIDNRTVPWSEAHMRRVIEYEQAVADEFGPEAVDKLPWRNVPRGEEAKRRM